MDERRLQPEIEQNSELTLERAQGLIWKGFELSQGSNPLLRQMWSWVHHNFPNYRVDGRMQAALTHRLKPPLQTFLVPGQENPGVHVTGNRSGEFSHHQIGRTAEDQADIFAHIMAGKPLTIPNDEKLLPGIFKSLLAKDYQYLVKNQGRPGDPTKKDIWHSNVCAHALSKMPASTTCKEYDLMWQQISSRLKEFCSGANMDIIRQVARVYSEHHLNTELNLDIIGN